MTRADKVALVGGVAVGAVLVYRSLIKGPSRLESWCWLKAEQLDGHAHGGRGEVPRCASDAALVTD